jgi:hypothetical protein
MGLKIVAWSEPANRRATASGASAETRSEPESPGLDIGVETI